MEWQGICVALAIVDYDVATLAGPLRDVYPKLDESRPQTRISSGHARPVGSGLGDRTATTARNWARARPAGAGRRGR